MADNQVVGIIWSGFPQPWQQPLLDSLGSRYEVHTRYARGAGPRLLQQFAAELLGDRAVDLIVVGDTPAALAAKSETSTVPIVVAASADCVATGLVKNARRPEGNLTGLTSHRADDLRLLVLLDFLHDNGRPASPIAVLWNRDNPAKQLEFEKTQAIASTLEASVHLRSLAVSGPDYAFETAFRAAQDSNALVVLEDPVAVQYRQQIVDLAGACELPAIYESRPFVELGGLMSLGADRFAAYRRTAECVMQILDHGLQAGNLPAVEELEMQLVINQVVARDLGFETIPGQLRGYVPNVVHFGRKPGTGFGPTGISQPGTDK